MQHRRSFDFFVISVILALVHGGLTQDLRNVTEPKTPETCISLKASGGDDTEAIQSALNNCTQGKAVALSSGIFNAGNFKIPSGVSLLVDNNVTLKAIPNPRLYGPSTCGTLNSVGGGCWPFIEISGAKGSGIYGKGTIDGQGDQILTGKNHTWYDLIMHSSSTKHHNNPIMLKIKSSEDITLYQITLKNSPSFHVFTSDTNGFTVWGVTIKAPASIGNTDAIDPTGSQNVTIAHCNISVGDDNIAIAAEHAPARHISVLNNYFGSGNGMCIGSGTHKGVSDVLVSGLTCSKTKNGIHIKTDRTDGGLVTRITYDNICVYEAVKPIDLDMTYFGYVGAREAEYRNITFNHVRMVTKGIYKFHGLSASNPIMVTMNDVHIAEGSRWHANYVNITGKILVDASGHCGWAGNN
ncbi:endo-polygalacturonase-like [Bacillus rossius redtenbacheri]|uniref:endo-polygalacturonase-like n=1 Tax=Bacillus rossius redtenbacheri TaxID=93214 RepID=UPI002FDD1103